MKFEVLYSQEKDIRNYIDSVWKFRYLKHGRDNIQQNLLNPHPEFFKIKLKNAKTKEEAKKVIQDYLNWRENSFAPTTPIIVNWLNKNLNHKKKEIVNKLESVYKKKFPFKIIKIYLTTVNIYPYSFKEKWFMTGKNQSIEGHLKTVLHELNHFMFYYYYSNLKKNLGIKNYEILKEALAIYTNPEGNDKPDVKKLEDYFKENINKSISNVLAQETWKKYL